MLFTAKNLSLNYSRENMSSYGINLIECLSISLPSSYKLILLIIEIIAIILHILVFLVLALNKKFHSRHSIYLFNLSIIGFISVFNSLKVSDSKLLCIYSSGFYCQYQGMFFQFSIFVYSYSVLAMAAYRFICVNYKNLNQILKTWKIIFSIISIWIISLALVLVPKFVSNIPVLYHYGLDRCIENYFNRIYSFWLLVLLGFVFPSISIAIFYFMIFSKIKKSRSKVSNLSGYNSKYFIKINLADKSQVNASNFSTAGLEQTSSTENVLKLSKINSSSRIISRHYYFQIKLIIHFFIIYLSYLIYSVSNFLLIYQTTLNNIYWKHIWIEMFEIFVSLYHLCCPIFYLGFHPITIERVKKNFKKFFLLQFK